MYLSSKLKQHRRPHLSALYRNQLPHTLASDLHDR